MHNKRFGSDKSALETRHEAQRIAFSPVVFQATRLLRTTGILDIAHDCAEGVTAVEVAEKVGLSVYAATILLECGLSANLFEYKQDRFVITSLGSFIRRDEMTAINMDFMHEVCFLGMHALEESLKAGAPAGLRVFGQQWNTVYEALAHLPEPAKRAWLRFDHFYSDAAFPAASRIVLAKNPRHMLEIGCNTGKWAIRCLTQSPELRMSLIDLPGQLEMTFANLRGKGLDGRAAACPLDVLDPNAEFPADCDAVWMSQFLCCFSEEQVKSILSRASRAVRSGGRIWILDTFWDRQRFDTAAYCLINTSPYFTAIANGNSRMYRAEDILAMAKEVGLELTRAHDGLGYYHSLLEFAVTSR